MRGFFGRQRGDKPPASAAVIDSYETSLYPPRPYRCHTIEGVAGTPDQHTVILPSIDADSVCSPFMKDTQTVNKNQRKPLLKDYVSCYVSPSCGDGQVLVPPAMEPLNVFHYITPSVSNIEDNGGDLASIIGLPAELRRFNVGYRSKVMEKSKDVLIPRFKRKRPPKPTRRGAKVTVSEPSASMLALETRSVVKRPREDDDLDSQKSLNSGEDEDDDISVQYEADDDDDGVSDGFDAGGGELEID